MTSDRDTFIVSVQGVLTLHPWLSPPMTKIEDLCQDGFSLVVARSTALGLSAFPREVSPVRWLHGDAGGDWTQDGQVRELAWLHADAAELPEQRLPLQPAFGLLGDVLRRLGSVDLSAVHALVPLSVGLRAPMQVFEMLSWFELDDPAAGSNLTVSVSTESGRHGIAEAVKREIDDMNYVDEQNRAALDLTPATSVRDPETLVGSINESCGPGYPGTTEVLAGRGLAWSLDFASWALEAVAEACRAAGETGHVVITVGVDQFAQTP